MKLHKDLADKMSRQFRAELNKSSKDGLIHESFYHFAGPHSDRWIVHFAVEVKPSDKIDHMWIGLRSSQMITPEKILLIITMARKKIDKGEKPDWRVIRDTIRAKFFEDYHVDMIERVYELEKDNPKYKPREVEEDYIDVNI